MSAMPLRPLGFGEILDGAFTLYRRHFITLLVSTLIPFIPMSLVNGMYTHATHATTATAATAAPNSEAAALEIIGWTLALLLVSGVLTIFAVAVLTRQTSQAFTGGEVSLGDGYAHGIRAFFPLLGAAILVYVALMIVLFGSIILVGIPAAFLVPVIVRNPAVAGIIGVAVAVGVGVAMLALVAMLFAAGPAVVVEKKGPWSALQRSRQLSKGQRLRILGVLLVSWLIIILPITAVMFAAGMGMTMFNPAATASLSTGQIFFQQIISFLSGSLTFPFFVTCTVLLYYDCRVRREADDPEIATEGLAPAG